MRGSYAESAEEVELVGKLFVNFIGTQMAVIDIGVVVSPEPFEELVRRHAVGLSRLDHILEEREDALLAVLAHRASQLVDQSQVVRLWGAFCSFLEQGFEFFVRDLDASKTQAVGELVYGALPRPVGVDNHELALELEESAWNLANSRIRQGLLLHEVVASALVGHSEVRRRLARVLPRAIVLLLGAAQHRHVVLHALVGRVDVGAVGSVVGIGLLGLLLLAKVVVRWTLLELTAISDLDD